MSNIQHPTQLWVSDHQTLHTHIIAHLQKKLCAKQGCLECITCKQITAQEHPWVIWLQPERSYTLEQIDEVLTLAGFTLDHNEQRFFIFTKAERLTDQCSNRLLKTIEEPFAGYNFFFLTNRIQALPLTIQSRCVIHTIKQQSSIEPYQDFLKPFLALQFYDPINFIKQLDLLDIKEQETKELTDELFAYWSHEVKQNIQAEIPTTTATAMTSILQQAIINQPMTGSAKIFWKNLYMTAHYATKHQNNTK